MLVPAGSAFLLHSVLRRGYPTREKLAAFQDWQLRRLVRHAYENVPYYRDLFQRHGLEPRHIRAVADLAHIPVTRKQDLQHLPQSEVIARGVDPAHLIQRGTSGSTGRPLIVHRTWWEERLLGARRLRASHDVGLRHADRVAHVTRVKHRHARDNNYPLSAIQALGWFRSVSIDCVLPFEAIADTLRRYRPDVVVGYPGVLARVVETMTRDGGTPLRPRLVTCGGETLTPERRQQISEGFGAPVLDRYGSHEFNLIAWECAVTGEYHVCDETVLLETLTDGRATVTGERGMAVGTALHSFAMPFIRYALEDIVTKGSVSCPCGAPFSTIAQVDGRTADYVRLPGGRLAHPFQINSALREARTWIHQFQLIQEREDLMTLRVVTATGDLTPDQRARTTEIMTRVVGHSVEVRIVPTLSIDPEPSGKFIAIKSLIATSFAARRGP